MKLTVGKLFDMQAALGALLELKNIKASLALRIVRLVKVLEPELKTLIEQRNKLIVKHGEAKDGSHSVLPGMPGFKAWSEAWTDLVKAELDVPVEPVELPEDVEIAPVTLLALEPLVTVAEEEPRRGPVGLVKE